MAGPSVLHGSLDLFVAYHGSWNRTSPVGYKVVRVVFRNGRPVRAEDFITGWLRQGRAWGRPADVLTAPDGALMVSDDAGGRNYRITYGRVPSAFLAPSVPAPR